MLSLQTQQSSWQKIASDINKSCTKQCQHFFVLFLAWQNMRWQEQWTNCQGQSLYMLSFHPQHSKRLVHVFKIMYKGYYTQTHQYTSEQTDLWCLHLYAYIVSHTHTRVPNTQTYAHKRCSCCLEPRRELQDVMFKASGGCDDVGRMLVSCRTWQWLLNVCEASAGWRNV